MNEPYPTEIADWPSATLTAVCRTAGCRAEGVLFEGVYFENLEPSLYRGAVRPVWAADQRPVVQQRDPSRVTADAPASWS